MTNLLDRKIMKPLQVQSYFGVYLKMTNGMKHWNQADVETGNEGWEKCLMADCCLRTLNMPHLPEMFVHQVQ